MVRVVIVLRMVLGLVKVNVVTKSQRIKIKINRKSGYENKTKI